MFGRRPASPTILLVALLGGVAVAPHAARAAVGGADGGGYTWNDSDDGCDRSVPSFGPDVRDFSGVTEMLGPFPLEFPLTWYDRPVTQVWVSPTGYVTFSDQGPAVAAPHAMPDPEPPNDAVAAHWTAVIDSSLRIESTPERFHVQWLQLIDPDESRWLTDLVIVPGGDMQVRWLAPALFEAATVGHEDETGALGRTIWRNGTGENGFRGPGTARSLCITAPNLLDCDSAIEISCNETVSSSLFAGQPSDVSEYSCAPGSFDHEERVFRLRTFDLLAVRAMVDSPGVSLFRIDAPPCSADACADYGPQELVYGLLPAGTYWFAVDSDFEDTTLPFDFSITCSSAFQTLTCGETRSGSTASGGRRFSEHGCAPMPLSGPEVAYQLSSPVEQSLTVTLDTAVADLWVVIYDRATFNAGSMECLAAGRGGASVPMAPAGEYVILVDGADDAQGTYSITATCGSELDCASAPEVGCEASIVGDTTGAPNVGVGYSCVEDALVAGEDVYRLTNPVQQNVRVEFLSSTPGQRLLLLTGCSSGECLVADEELVSCPRLPAGEFYLVVDGPPGVEGPYELSIDCSKVQIGVDLQVPVVDASALPSSCDGFDATGTVDVVVSNLGTEPTGTPFDVVVFEDSMPFDSVYDSGTDLFLGMATVLESIAGGDLVRVSVPTTGERSYRDSVLHAQVDVNDVVVEFDETNNSYDTGRGCEWRPPIGEFSPVTEWHWDASSTLPLWTQVDMTPLVGDVDLDGIPDVVVATGENPLGFDEGVVRVLSGADGSEIWTADQPEARVWATSNLAMADLDGDGAPEIIGHSWVATDPDPGMRLVALDNRGGVIWRSEPFIDHPTVIRGGGGPSIADIDCDGSPEIVYGANAFRADGSYFWVPEQGGTIGVNDDGRMLDGALSVVVDVDGDGMMEVVAGPTAYWYDPTTLDPDLGVATGRILWRQEAALDGFPAVGNFDADDLPEIVLTAYGIVYLLEGDTGEIVWQRSLPLGGGGCPPIQLVGGPPTVADFDGDCASEVGVAAADWYVVLETDGSLKWRVPIVDCSSHRTASSVFDFDGDGAAEVVFMDEERLRVYRGRDGTELARRAASSHTWQEMIVIADVDADDNAEIVMPANNTRTAGLRGVIVLGDVDNAWVDTRSIWNQHAYHVDNVLDDLSIPGPGDGCEAPSWIEHGTYRDQIGESVLDAPDLTLAIVGEPELVTSDCRRSAAVTFRAGNAGGRRVGQVPEVWFYDGDPFAGGTPIHVEPLTDLLPGESMEVTARIALTRIGTYEIHAIVDDDGTGRGVVNECRETNNACSTSIENPDFGTEPPDPVGPALRATGHGPVDEATITADFEWSLDAGLPRPDGDHYHVLRGIAPTGLAPLDELEPLFDLRFTDTTDRTPPELWPFVHFYKVLAADLCEQVEAAP